MPSCEKHKAEHDALTKRECDECVYEAQQQDRDKHREDDYLMRLRDRFALNFALTFYHDPSQRNSALTKEKAEAAYSNADVMLAARVKEKP
jgi:hypothetical protein